MSYFLFFEAAKPIPDTARTPRAAAIPISIVCAVESAFYDYRLTAPTAVNVGLIKGLSIGLALTCVYSTVDSRSSIGTYYLSYLMFKVLTVILRHNRNEHRHKHYHTQKCSY